MEREKIAQVAITNGVTWGIIGEYWSHSGVWESVPMPYVECPVIDVSKVDPDKCAAIMAKRSGPAGVLNVKKLIRSLENLGATVSYPVEVLVCEEHLSNPSKVHLQNV